MGVSSIVGFAAAALTLAAAGPYRAPVPAQHTPAGRTVVAELFTSEGCSSCPPADALLQQIVSESPVAGVEVLGLEEHVDYWDRLGWRDPFSSAVFSKRQADYADRVFRSDNIYTPQLVAGGAFQAIGSDRSAVRSAIAAAAARPAATVQISATTTGDEADVDVSVDIPASLERDGTGDVVVAIVEDALTSRVERGENGGRTLPHSAVVRSLNAIGTIPRDASGRSLHARVPLSHAWRGPHLRVVGFVQDRKTRRILGGGSAALRAPAQ